jgi:streptogramin lyase
MPRKPLALAATLIAVALQASSAHAAPTLAGTFPATGQLSGMPKLITAGPDGNVFFVIDGSGDNKQIGKIQPDGTVTEYASPNNDPLRGITAGPGGAIWATSTGKVVKMPPSDPSTGTDFTDANIGALSEITVGPDGNLWAGDATNGLVKIPPGNPGAGDTHFPALLSGQALGLTAGGDGNLWVANNTGDENSSIVRVDTTGQVVGTPTVTGNGLQQSELAAGPLGQVVFTQPIGGAVPERVGRMDYAGNVQFTNMPGGLGDPIGITFGNDGAYWIANFGANAVRRMTPAGDVTEPITFDAGSGPRQIAKGPNDTLWVSLETPQKIAKITGVSAPPVPPPPPPPPPSVTFTGLHLHGAFRVSGKSVTISIPCPSGQSTRCTGTIVLRTAKAVSAKKRHKTKLKLGSARFSIASGKTGHVKVKLSSKARKLVRRHSLKVKATITATASGQKKVTHATLTLKPPKRKR